MRYLRQLWLSWRDRLYRAGARSPTVARLAVVVRRGATMQIRYRLVSTLDPAENGEHWLLSELSPHLRTVLDVGANVGDWSRMVLERAGGVERLICFEPSDQAFAELRRRLEGDDRVELVQAAVADEVGVSRFYEEPGASQRSSMSPDWPVSAREVEVQIRTIDSEIERLGLPRIDLMKIDVEGHELHVLMGSQQALSRQAVRIIQFEYNRPWILSGSTLRAARSLLSGYGYELLLLNQSGLRRCDVDRLGELFEYLNFVAAPTDVITELGLQILPDPIWG